MTAVGRPIAAALFLATLASLCAWPPDGAAPTVAAAALLFALAGVAAAGVAGRPGPVPLVAAPAAGDPGGGPAAAVALDWAGPAETRPHVPQDYTLSARNVSGNPAERVVVQVRPCAVSVVRATDPPARVVDGVQVFEVGALAPGEGRDLRLTLVAATAAPGAHVECRAWVTFTGGAAARFAVRQPALAITLDAPPTAAPGETVTVRAGVTNVGDAAAGGAGVHLLNSSVPAGGGPVPVLAPGESAWFDFPVTVPEAGTQFWLAYCTLPPGGGGPADHLTAAQKAAAARACEAAATTAVVAPALKLTVAGPRELMVGRPGTFTVRVENVGTGPASAVALDGGLPAGWTLLDAPTAADCRVGDLAPGEARDLVFRATPTGPAAAAWAVGATAANAPPARAEHRTATFGVSALKMELLDTVDPVEVGGETVYEVRVTNTGTQADADVLLTCPVPAQMRLVAATGPGGHTAAALNGGTVVRFDPVPELLPRAEVVYRVRVTAVTAGDVRFQAQLYSRALTSPVVREESTQVYGD